MKKFSVIILILLCVGAFMMASCGKESNSTTDELYRPFWKETTMFNETVVLIKDGDNLPAGNLLFAPTKIISVKDYSLTETYDSSQYSVSGNKITATSTSTMPFLTTQQMAGIGAEALGVGTHVGKTSGTNILFTEGAGLVLQQVSVTYTHSGNWGGYKQSYLGNSLTKTISKLQTDKKLNLFLFGDSISTGANSSGKLGIEPYLDDFGTAVKKQLEKKYGAEVTYENGSYGGWNSYNGVQNIESALGNYLPDLAIIAFGMNDGSHSVSKESFGSNIENIMAKIREKSPSCEFLLIATMLANPESPQDTIQAGYLPVLEAIAVKEEGTGVVNMTGFTQELYKTKRGIDILANNINHPSDFLVRCYVMNIMSSLYENY